MNPDEEILSFLSKIIKGSDRKARCTKMDIEWTLRAEFSDLMKDLFCPSSNVCSFLF